MPTEAERPATAAGIVRSRTTRLTGIGDPVREVDRRADDHAGRRSGSLAVAPIDTRISHRGRSSSAPRSSKPAGAATSVNSADRRAPGAGPVAMSPGFARVRCDQLIETVENMALGASKCRIMSEKVGFCRIFAARDRWRGHQRRGAAVASQPPDTAAAVPVNPRGRHNEKAVSGRCCQREGLSRPKPRSASLRRPSISRH